MTHGPLSPTAQVPADSPSENEARLQVLIRQVAQLEESARQAMSQFEYLPTPALLLDAQGQIVRGNLRSHELLGVTSGMLVGRSFSSFLDAASQGTLTALLERAQKSGERLTGEVRLQGGPCHAVLEIVSHESVWLLTLTDVTAFKEAHRHLMDTAQFHEQQLRDANTELRQLTEEFEQVVHLSEQELQQRLSRARNFLSLYQQEGHRQQGQQRGEAASLTQVEETLTQAQNLLASLNQYMQMRFMRTRTRRVNLRQVWNEVVKGAQHELKGRDVQISSAALPTVEGDSQVFKIILNEFLLNALKFTRMREQTRLQVLVQETEDEYHIGVQDNGMGFNMRQKERVFELFSRLHADDQYEGTGLGLTVVRRLCARFGARAWGEGRPGEGATFWFAWPKGMTDT